MHSTSRRRPRAGLIGSMSTMRGPAGTRESASVEASGDRRFFGFSSGEKRGVVLNSWNHISSGDGASSDTENSSPQYGAPRAFV